MQYFSDASCSSVDSKEGFIACDGQCQVRLSDTLADKVDVSIDTGNGLGFGMRLATMHPE